MWLLISSVVAPALTALVSAFLPLASSNSAIYRVVSMPLPVFQAFINSVSVAGLFVDLPILFICVGAIFAWRTLWVVVRLYRVILELIPAMG